jgi:hypothetical protein
MPCCKVNTLNTQPATRGRCALPVKSVGRGVVDALDDFEPIGGGGGATGGVGSACTRFCLPASLLRGRPTGDAWAKCTATLAHYTPVSS